jgi:hypothetical protein
VLRADSFALPVERPEYDKAAAHEKKFMIRKRKLLSRREMQLMQLHDEADA